MNDKEISEIRRRYRAEKSGISRIRGCYVNEKRTIISEFDQSLGLMSESDGYFFIVQCFCSLRAVPGKI